MNKRYSFITKWQIKAPLPLVWEAIYESEEWPHWWKGVVSVKEVEKGNNRGIGSIRLYRLKSPMSYTLNFGLLLTDRIDLKLLKGKASGDLDGTGAWHFSESDGITYVECHWHVYTTIKWMNFFSVVLAPVFSYNHALVMKQGARCLARKLNAALISS